ncbi:tRNA1(Val) (adenine(37)-N6)-methyltransferase [Parasediminibacterium paludis]|uniref:tRNA1(Val) (adenine(37)-N6)-methyltransferase n=1 Tax=Parasediminibacterium paludis TaxID=908966 RepID=A0ABV8Q1T6_9BACT
MPNDYFQFKQFTIYQQHCAMKVTTDGCLFGAWAAANIQENALKVQRILDIGTGTGLLSIMLAQQSEAFIDAVEIDSAAAEQAKTNFHSAPWQLRLKVYETPIQNYINGPYDFIISNPPFFDKDLKSADAKRNLALHSSALSLEVLLANITRLLAANGEFAILLPYHRLTFFEDLATANGYYLYKKTLVQQTPKHPYFRGMLQFGCAKKEAIIDSIVIKEDSSYTAAFKDLLKDYYLKL